MNLKVVSNLFFALSLGGSTAYGLTGLSSEIVAVASALLFLGALAANLAAFKPLAFGFILGASGLVAYMGGAHLSTLILMSAVAAAAMVGVVMQMFKRSPERETA